MKIKHAPILNTEKIVEYYTQKDGVPIKYVCTSAIVEDADWAADIFYRDTPHPEFGNRYFAMYLSPMSNRLMITGADKIEDFEFGMIEDRDGDMWYSSHRHDCLFMDGNMIDGGRAYLRYEGEVSMFKVKDGEFVNV